MYGRLGVLRGVGPGTGAAAAVAPVWSGVCTVFLPRVPPLLVHALRMPFDAAQGPQSARDCARLLHPLSASSVLCHLGCPGPQEAPVRSCKRRHRAVCACCVWFDGNVQSPWPCAVETRSICRFAFAAAHCNYYLSLWMLAALRRGFPSPWARPLNRSRTAIGAWLEARDRRTKPFGHGPGATASQGPARRD